MGGSISYQTSSRPEALRRTARPVLPDRAVLLNTLLAENENERSALRTGEGAQPGERLRERGKRRLGQMNSSVHANEAQSVEIV
jgi:hypothetical protein